MKTHRIALIPGDGIGKEVIPAGVKVLQAAAKDPVVARVRDTTRDSAKTLDRRGFRPSSASEALFHQ